MDIQMPDMDGLEAITKIRKWEKTQSLESESANGHIPIIDLTALAMPGDKERCLKAGANKYLSKPVRLKQLLAHIREFI